MYLGRVPIPLLLRLFDQQHARHLDMPPCHVTPSSTDSTVRSSIRESVVNCSNVLGGGGVRDGLFRHKCAMVWLGDVLTSWAQQLRRYEESAARQQDDMYLPFQEGKDTIVLRVWAIHAHGAPITQGVKRRGF